MDVMREELARRLDDSTLAIIDVRSPSEYTGAGAACCARQGQIPGALNVDVRELLGRSSAQVRDAVGLPEGAEVVAYCHSGSRSALAADVLRTAGYDARNYAGSWHEWAGDSTLPVE